ncbi:hypothetical protein BJ875DRAFT_512194 [Amylocarpus encephaloides]|uniref:Zn(2)-C6 fungal-type domain-containing protein n=1 Tax=Amylocarpus encephaloides TaxID=45428 RepID=A0A9P8C4S0_9HELO|nr:hypothetical protein BJ875DRAFT_512194 [Amylocarpus encephaloides]
MEPAESSKSDYLTPNQGLPTELYRRPSLEREKSGKRGRASKPKVKSGCITCKTRRVKCDETKPQCIRCQKFGRVCDGYLPEQSQSRGLSNIQPRTRTPSVGLYNPSVSVHDTEDESRYFQVFAERTVYALPGFLDGTPASSFWTQIVLQESHKLSAVRHAVIALGALTKSLDNTPPPNLKVNIIQSINQRHHEQAVLQHLKAIQELNLYISSSRSPQLRNSLITCYLFICFEIFQGSFVSCVQQTYGGLKMLRSYYTGQENLRSSRSTSSHQTSSSRPAQLPTALHDQLNRENLTNSAIYSHVEEYIETSKNQRLAIEIQAPSPVSGTFGGSSLMSYGGSSYQDLLGADFDDEMDQTSMYTPNDYLNALPSNASSTNWQFLEYRSSSRPVSATSSPVLGTPPRSPSFTIPSTPAHLSSSRGPITSRSNSPPLLQGDLVIEEVLIQSFIRLDGQGLFFGMAPAIPPLAWDIHQMHDIPIPSIFPSFHEAHHCWDFLMDRVLQFYRKTTFNRSFYPGNSHSPEGVSQELTFWNNQLLAFESALQPILNNSVQPDGMVHNAAALVISLYQKSTVILLAIIANDSEMAYDEFLAEFQYIVNTCGLLIATRKATQLPRMPRFSVDIGILPPLHLVATKCREPMLRREVLNLLFSNPRQEGMWDGVLSARIARWVIAWEEEGLSLPPLPSGGAELSPSDNVSYGAPIRTNSWEFGNDLTETVDRMVTMGVNEYAGAGQGGGLLHSAGMTSQPMHPHMQRGQRASSARGLAIPEESRVRLTLIDYHIPDRYIKVRCQRALVGDDGSREERETVIAW